MSNNKKETEHPLDQFERDGKRFYHILNYSYEEVDEMFSKLKNGEMLTDDERAWLDENKLASLFRFSGSYEDLFDKPDIPNELIDLEDGSRVRDLEIDVQELKINMDEVLDGFEEVQTGFESKLDADRIQIAPEGGINFFYGTRLDEFINIGRPIDYDNLTEEDYDVLSKNINTAESKAPAYDSELGLVFCNGTLAVVEQGPDEDTLTISWKETMKESIEVPANIDIYAGGNGLESPANFATTGVIIKSGNVKNVYGGSLGQGNIGFTNILMSGGSVLTMTGGGQATYKRKDHKNHVGKNNIVMHGGEVETMFLGSQGAGIVNQTMLDMNDGVINDFTAGGENGTTLLTELAMRGGLIKKVQGINKGQVGCITYNLHGGKIEMFFAGGDNELDSADGSYICCRLFIDGTEFKFNPEPGKNNKVRNDASRVSGSIIKKYSEDLKINSNNIKKLNLTVMDFIFGDDISKVENDFTALVEELEKEENAFNLVKLGHHHTSNDIDDLIDTIQSLIEAKIEFIDINRFALKEEVAETFNSVNQVIDSIISSVSSLSARTDILTSRADSMEEDINRLETAINYRTTNEDIDEIITDLDKYFRSK